jgi:hypothetical protein
MSCNRPPGEHHGPERIKIKMEAHRIIHLQCLQLATSRNSSFTNFDMYRNSLMLMLEQQLTLMRILDDDDRAITGLVAAYEHPKSVENYPKY